MNIIEEMYDRWVAGTEAPDAWGNVTTEPPGVGYRETVAGGVQALWAEPEGAREGKAIVYFHGGGYVGGSLDTHRKLAGHLARATRTRTLLVHYRLAPEFAYPAQNEDALSAYQWVVDLGLDTVLAGDSVGGYLCIAVARRAEVKPAAMLLMSPSTDPELTGESYRTNAEHDRFFTREMVAGLIKIWLAHGEDPADPEINPLRADLSGLPPTFVQVGGNETLLDDSRMFAERARAAGVDVRLDVFDGQLHTFQMAAGNLPAADDAIGRFAAWLRPRF
ncbi:alpha/beta hydrolase [Actinoplanes sp. NPDC051633]|uniref:alpha/beta hydrolase n=1 Tax=Actinoplanes sp. NPDC051633 TaxID=3155670 RepID=UPI00342F1CA9